MSHSDSNSSDKRQNQGSETKDGLPLTASHHLSDSVLKGEAAEQIQVPDKIGPYQLIRLLGEGGMGSVWLAEQRKPIRRQVALKTIKHDRQHQKQIIARFEAERQALALMAHPNIAKVLEAGISEKHGPYFVMEYCRGEHITSFCNQKKLDLDQRLELFLQVCHAVQHAHQKGVIHRDLKPSNIIVIQQGDKFVPKVIDFGLAKSVLPAIRLTDKTLFSQAGVGTYKYMSPEQVSANPDDIDTRADIYALGIIL